MYEKLLVHDHFIKLQNKFYCHNILKAKDSMLFFTSAVKKSFFEFFNKLLD